MHFVRHRLQQVIFALEAFVQISEKPNNMLTVEDSKKVEKTVLNLLFSFRF